MTVIKIEPFFIHEEQVAAIIGAERTSFAFGCADSMVRLRGARQYSLASALASYLSELGIDELQQCTKRNGVHEGQLVGIQQAFYFRKAKERWTPGNKPIDFQGKLNTDSNVKVGGHFNSERFVSSSAAVELSGRRRVYVVGVVTESRANHIIIRPALIGIRTFIDESMRDHPAAQDNRRVYLSQINQFSSIDFSQYVSRADLKAVLDVPEQVVKGAFANLINEPFVPKDWGGEKSDLYSSQIFVRGRQMSSAWLFKGGPGFPGRMTIATLGKNGDQIDRLFSEPAELLVLQHCNEIKSAVINMMEIYASDMRRPRKYMIVDGLETALVLKESGVILTSSED